MHSVQVFSLWCVSDHAHFSMGEPCDGSMVTTQVLVLISAALLVVLVDGFLTYGMLKRGVTELNPVFRKLVARLGVGWAVLVSRVMMVPFLAIALWLDNIILAAFALAAPSMAVLYFFWNHIRGSTCEKSAE